MKMMKAKIIISIAMVAMLTGCGKEKLPKDGLLGELPSIVMENAKQESKLRQKMAKSSDSEDATEAFVNGIAQSQAFEEKIKQAGKGLIGKEIPTDVAKNVNISVSGPMKIEEVNKDGVIRIIGEGELTSDGTYMPNKGVVHFQDIRIVAYTNDGISYYAAPLNTVPDMAKLRDDLYPKGTMLSFNAYLRLKPWNAKDMASLKSIVITTKDRDDFRAADKSAKEAKEAFEKEDK